MSFGFGFGLRAGRRRGHVGSAFATETNALVARMSVAPSSDRKVQIDTLVKALKDAGVWSKLDCFYVLAAHDSQAGLLNWRQAAYDLSAVSSPTFTTDRGYQGDGVAGYLESNFAPLTAGGQFAQDSAMLSVRCTGVSENGNVIGIATAFMSPRNAGGNFTARLTNASTASVANANADGHFVLTRTGSAGFAGYRNGASLLDASSFASSTMDNRTIRILGQASSSPTFSTRQVSAAGWGSGLSGAEVAAYDAAVAAYMTAVGA